MVGRRGDRTARARLAGAAGAADWQPWLSWLRSARAPLLTAMLPDLRVEGDFFGSGGGGGFADIFSAHLAGFVQPTRSTRCWAQRRGRPLSRTTKATLTLVLCWRWRCWAPGAANAEGRCASGRWLRSLSSCWRLALRCASLGMTRSARPLILVLLALAAVFQRQSLSQPLQCHADAQPGRVGGPRAGGVAGSRNQRSAKTRVSGGRCGALTGAVCC